MMRALWGMARNDLAVWRRSPAAIGAALFPALGMGILVAVLTNSVGQQPVALVVQGHGRFADRMARVLRADADAYLLEEKDRDEAERAIGSQRVAAIVRLSIAPSHAPMHVKIATHISSANTVVTGATGTTP